MTEDTGGTMDNEAPAGDARENADGGYGKDGTGDGQDGDDGRNVIPARSDGSWTERVVFGAIPGGAPFAIRPREVLTNRASEAVAVANEVEGNRKKARIDPEEGRQIGEFRRLLDVADPLATVAHLRASGFVAQPNYVYFAHGGCGCGCCGGGGGGACPPHPAGPWWSYAQSVHPTPFGGQSVHPTPFGGQSVHPTPFGGQSVHPTPYGFQSVHPTPFLIASVHPTPYGGCGCGCGCGCGHGGAGAQSVHPTPYGTQSVHPTPYGTQSVHPTPASQWPTSVHPTPHGGCGCGCHGGAGAQSVHPTPFGTQSVHPTPFGTQSVHPTPRRSSAKPVPTGSAKAAAAAASMAAMHPAGGAHVVVLDTGLATGSQFPPAMANAPVTPFVGDPPDQADADPIPVDLLLDEVAGHGTFIAGLVTLVAPGCDVVVHRVLASVGDTDEETVVHRLLNLQFADPTHTVLSLSFGGYLPEHPQALAAAVKAIQVQGVVVVASAGNDGTCQPMYPAALPDVVSVGAIGPDGPAVFTNYGPWVRACAPGLDLTSTFFQFKGAEVPTAGEQDTDNFNGWAVWSGTSFSGPVVAGALARTMISEQCTAQEAVRRVVDHPSLLRLPGLGTVVNVL
ncbi:MAG TPA: S8/S53 family peptidase [Acidimicrobiales bacterium]